MKDKLLDFYRFFILLCTGFVAGITYWLYKGIDNLNVMVGLVMTSIVLLFLIRLAVAEANDIRKMYEKKIKE